MIKFYKAHKLGVLILFFAVGVFLLQFAVARIDKAAYPQKYETIVQQYANEFNVPQQLIYAVIHTESGFDEDATSEVDARGLMQITNETFEWIKLMIASDETLNFDDMYDASTNIRFGTYFLSVALLRYNGDIATCAAAYHSGMGLVGDLLEDENYSSNGVVLHTFPYEQMNYYVYKIESAYNKYLLLY